MAEKKVSSKNKRSIQKASVKKTQSQKRDAVYDDFLDKYGQELRKRSTRTVPEPKKYQNPDINADSARCGEIDPHLAVNPAAEHHILTKRSGRILTDDTGFKAQDYYQRFELKAEMPELKEEDSIPAQDGFEESAIPGQQTMADLVSVDPETEGIAVPVESKISDEETDPFSSAYQLIKSETPYFGKSEKLRAIARTASDDVGMEPESQLSFPAFDPLFKFDESDKKKKSKIRKQKNKKEKHEDQTKDFDIEEDQIVTAHTDREAEPVEETESEKENDIKTKSRRFFDVIDNNDLQEEEPVFEINSKQDIRSTSDKLKKIGREHLIKTCALLLFGIILSIISAVFNKSVESGSFDPAVFTVINIIFLILSCIFCIKELLEGIRDISKKKFTLNSGCLLIFISALMQSIAAPLSDSFPENIRILAPAAIFMMTTMTVPKLLLTNNSRLAVSIMGGNNAVSLFKPLSESGIEGAVKVKYADDDGSVRCNTSVQLTSGIIKKLTNAIPKPFAGNISYIFAIVFSLIVGVACGIITRSFANAVTAFSAMLMTCLPVSYTLTAAFLLFSENNSLAENKSSVISYRSAAETTKTKAIVFDVCDITEGASCSIHSIKTFGHTDSKKATLCCAAAIKAGNSPLLDIMQQVVEQGEQEIPETEDFIVCNGGIAALVGNDKVLLGTKEFLNENHVLVPDEDFEEKYVTGDRKLLFLSVNGDFCMLLIVSYHIRRSVASFFKYLAEKNISVLIHSSDPNITPAYIEKKCKLPKGSVASPSEPEAAYFRDKASKTETALECDVFTDGKISSLFALFRSAYKLEQTIGILPTMILILSFAGALLVAVPVLSGNIEAVGSLYIMIIKIICTVLAVAVPSLISRKTRRN